MTALIVAGAMAGTAGPAQAAGTRIGYPVSLGLASAPQRQPGPLVVNNPGNQQSLTTATVSLQMTATGGTTPYTWSATGLPVSLTINSSTGLISGITGISGGYPVTVTVTDAAAGTADTQFLWTVRRGGCPHC